MGSEGATRAKFLSGVADKGHDNQCCRRGNLPSAHKHGISDDDMRHAFENAVASITVPDQPDFSMIIGPDESGRLLEIGVVADDDND